MTKLLSTTAAAFVLAGCGLLPNSRPTQTTIVLTGEGEATLITTDNPKVTKVLSGDRGAKTMHNEDEGYTETNRHGATKHFKLGR